MYCRKATVEWNIMENILEKKEELKLKKMKMKVFNFLCKIATYGKFYSQKLQSFWIMKM